MGCRWAYSNDNRIGVIVKKRIVILLVLLFAVQVNAVTRYIDFSVGNDANDGETEGEAWLTESYADTQLSTNDILRYVQADWGSTVLTDWEALANDGVITWTKEIKQWAITWTIDGYERFGRYANGDFWIYDATSIALTTIDPISTNAAGWIKNGSMVNPDPTVASQGYDNSTSPLGYSAALNVALDNDFPITINTESSLVSAKSSSEGARPQLTDVSILTVVDTVPGTGDFRPPYCGSDKTSNYNVSAFVTQDVYDSILEKLTPATGVPSQGTVERRVQRPWLEHITGSSGEDIRPTNNYFTGYGTNPTYAEYVCEKSGDVALWLHCNYSDAVKKTTLTGYVQIGIDYYGIITAGGTNLWPPGGGHGSGRKWYIIFAGLVLDVAAMRDIDGDADFGMDDQSFAVASGDVLSFPYTKGTFQHSGGSFWGKREDLSGTSKEYLEYVDYHLDMPEWGIKHLTTPLQDGANWNTNYRTCCTAVAWYGEVLAALITRYGEADWGKTLWNHDSIFDYMDRYDNVDGTVNSTFQENMWDDFRANYGTPWSGSYDITAAATPTVLAQVPDSNTYNSITVSWSGAAAVHDISTKQTVAYLGVTSPHEITGLRPSVSYEIEVWGKKANGIRSLVPDELTVTTEASTASLIAHYKCDDNAGQTTVLDSSGNNLTGTAANNITSTTGKVGNAITFNGTSDYVTILDNPTFDGTSAITVAGWAKNDNADIGASELHTIVSKYSLADNKREWHLYLTDAEKVGLFVSEDGTFDAGKAWSWTTDVAVTVSEWHHYAFTFDAGTFAIYVDGVSVAITDSLSNSGTFFNNDNVRPLIGARYSDFSLLTTQSYFDGDIDDVRIYNEALTQSQIAGLIGTGRYDAPSRNHRRSRY